MCVCLWGANRARRGPAALARAHAPLAFGTERWWLHRMATSRLARLNSATCDGPGGSATLTSEGVSEEGYCMVWLFSD